MAELIGRLCSSCGENEYGEEESRCKLYYSRYYELGEEGCSGFKRKDEMEKGVDGWEDVYHQCTVGVELKKAGGGDKADRTHKIFGKGRMKDNRGRQGWEYPRFWKHMR